MKSIQDIVKRYLTRVGVEDAIEQGEFDFSNGGSKFVPLSEHDKKFHPNGYDEKKESCTKREKMASVDKTDSAIKGKEKADIADDDEARAQRWKDYLRGASDKAIGEAIEKYGDEKKYPRICELIKAETDRRARIDMERWYREHGEQV